jgi:hypothetical protein
MDTGYRSEVGLRILAGRQAYVLRVGGFEGAGLCGFPAEPSLQLCNLLDASVFQECLATGQGPNCSPIDGGWVTDCQSLDVAPDPC